MVAKSNLLNPGPGSCDFFGAGRNIVEVKTTPATRLSTRAPIAAAEIVPRLVPTRNIGFSGNRFPKSSITAATSA